MEHRYMIKKQIRAITVMLITLCVFLLLIQLMKRSLLPHVTTSSNSQVAATVSTKKIAGTKVLPTDSWNLILVNNTNYLPTDFTVELTSLINGNAVDKRIYADLNAMMEDAKNAGCTLYICSSYRTREMQAELSTNDINKYIGQGFSPEKAQKLSGSWVALPGASEHQTGLALDIVAANYVVLDETQENTPEQKWLMNNCYNYGFILRYPIDKSTVTGIGYEPWHYRYVGKEAAKEITEKGLCLEEYLTPMSY